MTDDLVQLAEQRAETYARENPNDPERWRRMTTIELIQEAIEELADAENYVWWAFSRSEETRLEQRTEIGRCLWYARADGSSAYDWLCQALRLAGGTP